MKRLSCLLAISVVALAVLGFGLKRAEADPAPLLSQGHPVDWVFVYKFNSASFPGCPDQAAVSCPFGGEPQAYRQGQQYAFASSENPTLALGKNCLGDTEYDPVGATFGQIYNGDFHYVVWNDQFYGDPAIKGCTNSCSSPWGHSKGLLAWDDTGAGVVMQVSTPSWPASGSAKNPRRTDGNTLGCVEDNDVLVAQHFFAVKLTREDVLAVASALANASVVTDVDNSQIVSNGGPSEIADVVAGLGKRSKADSPIRFKLSTGIVLISKPSSLAVPPWQLVSVQLGGSPLRVATWYANPQIPDTDGSDLPGCWANGLGQPGAVVSAKEGHFGSTKFSLIGGPGSDRNHAKLGVSVGRGAPLTIFGDLNQDGALSGTAQQCKSSQNGRGGLFFVLENADLHQSISELISPIGERR